MHSLTEIRGAIESLNPQQLPIQKAELLSMVESLSSMPLSSMTLGSLQPEKATHQRLSPRESEVMNMILGGRRLKEIAAQLDISVKTVTTHRSRLLRKLGLEDNLGLCRYGVRHGLISV